MCERVARTPRRHEVGDNANDEDVPRARAEDQSRIHAGVTARNEQDVRLLTWREARHERAATAVFGLSEGAGTVEQRRQTVFLGSFTVLPFPELSVSCRQ